MNTSRPNQNGAVLVMSLSILVILTLLGVSAMSSSSLEVKMATSVQDTATAFHAAESGLGKMQSATGKFDVSSDTTSNFTFNSASAEIITSFTDFTPPRRGSGYSIINYQVANFDQTSTGTTTTKAKSVVHQGIFQVVNK